MLDQALRFFSLADANVRYVLLGSLLIGGTSGLLGCFGVLRKRSLMGDALAHAALPGVALAFMLTGSKALPVLILGAAISGLLGVLAIQVIVGQTRIKSDAAIGLVLSVFFGLGIVLLTHVQRSGAGNQSGLDKFLFGQAASLVEEDLRVMAWLAAGILAAVVLFFKEFKGLIFDAGFLHASGFPTRLVDLGLMGLIVLTVMVGLQAVGVVLMAAMLITPAVAARFWTERLLTMVWLSALFGSLSGAVGTFVSSLAPRLPTGPVMVLVATALFAFSALFAPRRGALARWRQHRANVRRETRHHLLRAAVELEERGVRGLGLDQLAARLGWPQGRVRRWAGRLTREGLIQTVQGQWQLTEAGRQQGAFVVKSHRLWEHYLVHREILAADHVDRPADEVEHLLTPEIITRLEEILQQERQLDITRLGDLHQGESGHRPGGREG